MVSLLIQFIQTGKQTFLVKIVADCGSTRYFHWVNVQDKVTVER